MRGSWRFPFPAISTGNILSSRGWFDWRADDGLHRADKLDCDKFRGRPVLWQYPGYFYYINVLVAVSVLVIMDL